MDNNNKDLDEETIEDKRRRKKRLMLRKMLKGELAQISRPSKQKKKKISRRELHRPSALEALEIIVKSSKS